MAFRVSALVRDGGLAVCGALLLLTSACSESVPPPIGPSSLPGDKVQVLSLACAANASRRSLDGLPVRVQYGSPMAQGGLEPVATTCTPASGTRFPVGTNAVTCTAEDGLQQTASCVLSVIVVPTLRVTNIMAFGDSLTAGTTASQVQTIVQLDPASSYPVKLRALLNQRYSGQSIQIVNSGLPGEFVTEALSRLRSELSREQPDVVIIMEGTNDLSPDSTSGGDSAAAAVESMVREAKARGADPIMATIPPQRANRATAAQVPPYNERLRQVATRENVPLVDLFQIINSGLCGDGPSVFSLPSDFRSVHTTVPCIGEDGVHPTRQGYDLIAAAFFNRIMKIYEVGSAGGSSILPQAQVPWGQPSATFGPVGTSGFR